MKRFPKLIPYVNGVPLYQFPKRGSTHHHQYGYSYATRNSHGPDGGWKIDWKPNVSIHMALQFDGIYLGSNGSCDVRFTGGPGTGGTTDNHQYSMRADTFNTYFKTITLVTGVIVADFVFERSGNACYIAPAFMKTPDNSEV